MVEDTEGQKLVANNIVPLYYFRPSPQSKRVLGGSDFPFLNVTVRTVTLISQSQCDSARQPAPSNRPSAQYPGVSSFEFPVRDLHSILPSALIIFLHP